MAVSHKSSGKLETFTLQCVDITDLDHVGLSDFVSSASTIYSIDITNNNGGIVFVRLYNNKSPTYGTTDPDIMFVVAANTRSVWTIAQGATMSLGVSAQGTAADGSTPGSAIDVSLVMT